MKILIAGFGSIGRRHFRNLQALGERDILFYRTGKSRLPPKELKGLIIEDDLDRALAHQPDAVIVANPTALHLDVAISSAKQGCHIFLEKPISHNLDRVEDFAKAVEDNGVRVLVGFQFRFHPTLQTVRESITSRKLGRPLSAHAHWGEFLPNWHPWEDYKNSYAATAALGGGVVLTLCHPFDYLRWMFGDVMTVWGVTRQSGRLKIDVEDQAEAGLEFVNGAFASVHLDYIQSPATHRLLIDCEEGQITWNGGDGNLSITASDGWEAELPAPADFERNDLFYSEMQHFLDLASGKTNSICPLKDGIEALKVALAVHQSAETGQKIRLNS
jgi:predicted dehydrogenase